jgi:hypothetical protein
MKKFLVLFGMGVGFVLGSKAGRGPYERLRSTARDLSERREYKRLARTVSDRADPLTEETVDTVADIADRVGAKGGHDGGHAASA